MRIAVLTSSYPRYQGDGSAPFVESIAEWMHKLGNDVEVVAPYDPLVTRTEKDGIKIHRFHYSLFNKLYIMGHGRALEADVRLNPLAILLLPIYLIAAFMALWRVTGQQKTDVIHVHWVLPNGPVAAFVAMIRDIPFIVSLHGSDIYLAQKNYFFGVLTHWVFSRASGVTACSQELKERALKLGAPERTLLLAWGADPQRFKPADSRTELRLKFGWGDDLVIITIGRMVYKKGFDILLRALPYVLEKYPDIKVIIGGDGALLNDLKQLAVNLGIANSVQFPGRISWNQMPDMLATTDIFVLPSVRDKSGNVDGLPTVLLEAMACGTAIIASDIGGVPLAIKDNVNGLLVAPGSVEELKQSLIRLIADSILCEKLGSAARNTVETDLNWGNVAQRLINYFKLSSLNKPDKIRMGTIYRDTMLQNLAYDEPIKGRVLDVGCYDGYLLSKINAKFRVGVDLNPIPGLVDIHLIKADARFLPFKPGSFDLIYAMEIIEHIEDDVTFSKSLVDALASNGKLILTTPSDKIRLYPPFLTVWISKKWGHVYRRGYSPDRLTDLFGDKLEVKIHPWNAPGYRLLYPLLRGLKPIFPKVVGKCVRAVGVYDSKRREGQLGFQVMVARTKSNKST
jgi:glycosyltransferase involved in cell wall biosynthesis